MIALLPIAKAAAPYVLGLALGAALWHVTPIIGPGARIDALRASLSDARQQARDWQAMSEAWEARAGLSDAFRASETRQANAALSEAQEQCEARVTEARRSGAAVRTIIQREPVYDEANCPVRELVPSDSLRDAIGARSAD
jgi:hypothetical protein